MILNLLLLISFNYYINEINTKLVAHHYSKKKKKILFWGKFQHSIKRSLFRCCLKDQFCHSADVLKRISVNAVCINIHNLQLICIFVYSDDRGWCAVC